MKLKKLPGMPEPFGVEITDIPKISEMTKSEWQELAHVCLNHLVWIIKGQSDLTKEKFSRLCYSWGRPGTFNIDELDRFDTEEEKQEIIDELTRMSFKRLPGLGRVTGMRDEEGNTTGMFADGELDWHSNESGRKNSHPVVLLHGIEGTKGSETHYIENVTPYDNLNSADKNLVDSLICIYKYDKDTNYMESKGDDFTDVVSFGEGVNGVSSLQHKLVWLNTYSSESLQEKPLIATSPGGHKGFAFNFHAFNTFKNKTEQESKEIIEWLKSYLLVDERIYKQYWEDGDLCAFDQIVTLHRRPTEDCSNRLLHRMAVDFSRVEYNDKNIGVCGE